jgi:Tol biopolymer transport system component
VYNALEDTAFPVLNTSFDERNPAISPDGKWIAYRSDRTGLYQIYITPYPGPVIEKMVSTNGGSEPVWSHDGKELFYREGDKMISVAVETKPSLNWETPVMLFEGQYVEGQYLVGGNPQYDIHPDGDKFLMIKTEDEPQLNQINVVLNWFEELKRLDRLTNK